MTTSKRDKVIDYIALVTKPLVWYSVIMLFLEIHAGAETSHESHWFFLWSERFVAGVMTIEYVLRWKKSGKFLEYPLSAFGIIDLISIVPFWAGFFLTSQSSLHLVRTLRCLRMLKFFRYSRSLQLMALGFYRSWFNLKPLLFTTFIVVMFTMFALYEVEGPHQEEFRDLFTVLYFLETTATTVGYGDHSPATVGGRLIVMGFMVVGLAIFMACFSAITNAFDKTIEEEIDPNIDPLEEFKKVREQRKGKGKWFSWRNNEV